MPSAPAIAPFDRQVVGRVSEMSAPMTLTATEGRAE